MTLKLPLLAEPAQLEAQLTDPTLLIVDVCQPQNWQRLHLPGAVHINPSELVCGIPPSGGKMPTLPQLNALLGRIGYRNDLHIVSYDDEGVGWAGRLLWTLDVIGHPGGYSLLDGGLHSWLNEGRPLTTEVRAVPSTVVNATIHHEPIAELDTVLAALGNSQIKIWDARSREEYLGLRSGSARAGHIPGAINIDWLDTMDKARDLRLLPLPIIRAKLRQLGVQDGDSIITHCQGHHRSGLTYVIAKLLGYSVQGYHGSWGEWGNNPDVPVETTA